jgi:carbamoyltransferase
MRILGLSAFHRDSAAALVVDGVPVSASREERFTKKRGDSAFPRRAARFCLDRAGLAARDLDRVVFYEKPLRKFERVLAMQLQCFPRSSRTFTRSMFTWLGDRLWLASRIADELAVDVARVAFVEHQQAHAASAFYASPFERAAVLTIDDAGEWATAALARGDGAALEVAAEVHFPHSLGLVASAVAQFLGFEPGADEGKVAALARFGAPRFARELAQLVRAVEPGGFAVDARAFRFAFDNERLFDARLGELLGPPRAPGSPLRYRAPDTRDADVAASLQALIEERSLALARDLHARAGDDSLCFAGELALNRALNARLATDGPFREVFVPPDPGEAGAALGAALYVAHAVEGAPRRFRQSHARFGDAAGERAEEGASPLGGRERGCEEVLQRVARGEIVGWMRGESELAPFSLGQRCALASARGVDARERLLAAVQQSEPWLPARIAVVAERAPDYFELPDGCERALRFAQLEVRAKDALHAVAPSAIQPGGAAWVQIVDREDDPELFAVLARLGGATGAPLALIGTLELRGQPAVCSEADAVDLFRRSKLDALVVEDRLYVRP